MNVQKFQIFMLMISSFYMLPKITFLLVVIIFSRWLFGATTQIGGSREWTTNKKATLVSIVTDLGHCDDTICHHWVTQRLWNQNSVNHPTYKNHTLELLKTKWAFSRKNSLIWRPLYSRAIDWKLNGPK